MSDELDLLRAVEREARALREPAGYESGASSHGLDETLAALDAWRGSRERVKTHTETVDLAPRAGTSVCWRPRALGMLRNVVLESSGSPVHLNYVLVGNKIICRWDRRDPVVMPDTGVRAIIENSGDDLAQARVTFEYEDDLGAEDDA